MRAHDMCTDKGRPDTMNSSDGRPSGRRRGWAAALALLVGLGGCDFLDPTNVENPRTTGEDLAQAAQPVRALLPGLRANFARAMSATVTNTENVSDNYSIHGTGILKELDDPRSVTPAVANGTGGSTGAYWTAQELRALADFVLDEIAPAAGNATPAQIAEARYYRGMALLLLSENFSHAPREEDGPLVPAAQLRDMAVTDLQAATAAEAPIGLAAEAALARAFRWAGDAGQARQHAQNVLSADPNFLFMVEYDASSVSNGPFSFLFLRALQEMQPLPRLDFLDPKFTSREAGIPVAKAEEMHLILAEADLAAQNGASGRAHLVDAIEVASARPVESFNDNDPRASLDLSIRPRDSEILVRADANSPYRAGLVLDRLEPGIPVPTISSTSLDPDSIAGIPAGDMDALWHALWLARQEILFLEGRRMADLGIRLPIMLREIDTNPNISEGDPGTVAVVPAYIPEGDRMDLFEPFTLYEGDLLDDSQTLVGDRVTILVDMNRVLVQNAVSPFQN